jgi:predicted DCC family thiol-disulfide oxidoreductase YuxK
MNTSKQDHAIRAWLFYDGECPICCRWVERLRAPLSKHHFGFAPLQSDFAQKTLRLNPGEIPGEMKSLTAEGAVLGGADAALHIARFLWWAKPISLAAWLPGGKALIRWLYKRVAAQRYCFGGKCKL